jgi:pilus assembly protein CpaC
VKFISTLKRAAICTVACGAVLAAAPRAAEADDMAGGEVVVGVGQSHLVELPVPYSGVMIADPKIADVVPLNPHAVYVLGRAMGSTALTLYGSGRRTILSLSVVVSADLEGLKTRLHQLLPGETQIAVSAANQSIVLSGTVSSPAVLGQVMTLADTYDPGKVVNMMSVEGAQQVMLSVRFVEMERTTAKDLRLNVNVNTKTSTDVVVNTGDSLATAASAALKSFGAASLLFRAGSGELGVLFDALETKGLVKTLAEPTLVTMSGDTANFLAGGEFPIPVAQQSGGAAGAAPTITIEYKQFGISLAFTPTILQDGLINMVVNPEVSSIDPTTSVSVGIISVPGIKVRRAHTTVELRDGESFTIAGLLANNYESSIRQMPFIGDIPILGALFRSTGFKADQTELVLVVTPHLVTPRRAYAATPADHFVPPSDFELFVFGAQRGKESNVRPEDRALLSMDPGKGGVEGSYGHVLY